VNTNQLHEFIRRMPKVELHVHLEGSIRPGTLLELAGRHSVRLPAESEAGLQDFYRFRDFNHFIEVYLTITGCLRTPEDYRLIAYEFGCDCARQNIRYAEVTFTMESNQRMSGLPWEAILSGLNAGRLQARAEFGVDWGWIFDINRNRPVTQAEVVAMALAARPQGVVALGLGGSEAEFPPELFTAAFDRAHQAGLACIPHAGETAGPDSIWTALDRLHAVRIGHGVRAIDDPLLVEALRLRQVPLEICPTSNIRLGVYPDYASHPLRRLWQAGLFVTVNSDDPPMFNTDLSHEYSLLVDEFGFGLSELKQLSLNALRASLLPEADRVRLEGDFMVEFDRLEQELG
jgi:adenosine deaminase